MIFIKFYINIIIFIYPLMILDHFQSFKPNLQYHQLPEIN